jgi:hypothetical protein
VKGIFDNRRKEAADGLERRNMVLPTRRKSLRGFHSQLCNRTRLVSGRDFNKKAFCCSSLVRGPERKGSKGRTDLYAVLPLDLTGSSAAVMADLNGKTALYPDLAARKPVYLLGYNATS